MGFLSEDPHCTKPASDCPTCRLSLGVGVRGSAEDFVRLGVPSTIGLQIQFTIDVDSGLDPKVHRRESMKGVRGRMGLLQKAVTLFIVGASFALVLNLLQRQRQVTVFPPGYFNDLLATAWWVPVSCGLAGVAIGLLYPCVDRYVGGHAHHFKREWSSVMRCVAMFVGINHASAKINFVNNAQLSLTLAALSLGLWWLFDRSGWGLALSALIAALATGITQVLVFCDVYWYSDPDFLYIRSWVPFIFFSGIVTMGVIGRQLASGEVDFLSHEHTE